MTSPLHATNMTPEEAGSHVKDFWRVLSRGRWYVLSSLLITVSVTALFTFTANPVYESSAEVLVEKSKLNLDVASLVNPFSSGSRNDLENRIEVLTSDPVLERARDALASHPEYLALRQLNLARGSLFDRVVHAFNAPDSDEPELLAPLKEIKQNLTARPIRNTDIIEIRARAGSAREAQILANTVIQAYLDQDVEVTKKTISNVKTFLESQLEQTQARLEASELRAVEFQKTSGLELGPEGASRNLVELQKLYMTAQIELQDKQGARQILDHLLADVKRELLSRVSDPSHLNVILEAEDKLIQIKKLQEEISQLEQERQAYLDAHDYLRAQQTQEKIFQKKQAIERATTAQFPALELFPKYEELIRKQLELSWQIEALQNRVGVIKQKIDVETKKLVDNGLELLRFQRNLDIDKSIYVLLRQEYEKSRIAEAGELGTTRVVNWASEPEKPIAPKKGLNLLLALLVGLTLGTGLAFVREQLDNTFKSPKEIEKELGIANLGVVFAIEPRRAGGAPGPQLIAETLIVDRDAADLDFNAYLTLEANLRFASLDRPMRSLLVTSSVPREGKSTTAANLGLVLSVVGKKTLLVDGDLRKPVFAQLFGLRGGKGLSDLALSEIALNEVLQRPADQRHFLELHLAEKLVAGGYLTQKQLDRAMRDFRPSDHEPYLGDLLVNAGLLSADDHAQILQQRRQKLAHLWVLPAGTMPPNPTALLGSERMDEILKELEERFDLVVFDSPPVTAVPDASVLSTKVDGTLLVIEAERTERDAARHAVDQLRRAGGNLIGFILNFLQKSKASYYGSYYSSSYYGYVGAQRDADAHRR